MCIVPVDQHLLLAVHVADKEAMLRECLEKAMAKRGRFSSELMSIDYKCQEVTVKTFSFVIPCRWNNQETHLPKP